MTYHEKWNFLQRYRWLDHMIQDHLALSAHWRSRAEQMTAHYGVAGQSPDSPGFPAALEKVLELEQQIETETEELKALYQVIHQSLQQLPDPREAMVLKERFLLGYSFEKIAQRMHYDVSYIHRLKKDGINHLQLSMFVHKSCDTIKAGKFGPRESQHA